MRRTVDPGLGERLRRLLDHLVELGLDRLGELLRHHAPVEAEGDPVGHDVGVDAALDQPDRQLRAADALDLASAARASVLRQA